MPQSLLCQTWKSNIPRIQYIHERTACLEESRGSYVHGRAHTTHTLICTTRSLVVLLLQRQGQTLLLYLSSHNTALTSQYLHTLFKWQSCLQTPAHHKGVLVQPTCMCSLFLLAKLPQCEFASILYKCTHIFQETITLYA